MLKEVVIEGEVVDVICQGERPKGNINNRDNTEDHPNNKVGRSLQPYQAPSQQYGRNINYRGFQGPSTNVKRYKNWNFCHTYGFDVKDKHDISNCRNTSWNHNWQETCENTMVGSQRNKSKCFLSSQVPNPIPPQHWLTGTATCVNDDTLLIQESYITQDWTPPKYIIPDTGYTVNYVSPSIELNKITEGSIRVRMPDAKKIQSTHCDKLNLL